MVNLFLFPIRSDFIAPSTALATVWLGCQCGRVYIHSAVLHWKKPLHVIKLPDAVLAIMYVICRCGKYEERDFLL